MGEMYGKSIFHQFFFFFCIILSFNYINKKSNNVVGYAGLSLSFKYSSIASRVVPTTKR